MSDEKEGKGAKETKTVSAGGTISLQSFDKASDKAQETAKKLLMIKPDKWIRQTFYPCFDPLHESTIDVCTINWSLGKNSMSFVDVYIYPDGMVNYQGHFLPDEWMKAFGVSAKCGPWETFTDTRETADEACKELSSRFARVNTKPCE
jgi:hypothetical protein